MTKAENEIKELRSKISSGKWVVRPQGQHLGVYGTEWKATICNKLPDDAAFIAAAPEIVDQLLARVEELELKISTIEI